MKRPPPTGFAWTSKLKLIEGIGFTIALCGLIIALLGTWQLFKTGEFRGASSMSLWIGGLMLLLGIDLAVKPDARRLPSPQRIADTILRYRVGLGPNDPQSDTDATWVDRPDRLPNGLSNHLSNEHQDQPHSEQL